MVLAYLPTKLGHKYGVNVCKYSSTMEHLGYGLTWFNMEESGILCMIYHTLCTHAFPCIIFVWIKYTETVAKGVSTVRPHHPYPSTVSQSWGAHGRASWHQRPCSSWSVESRRSIHFHMDVSGCRTGSVGALDAQKNDHTHEDIPKKRFQSGCRSRLPTCRLQGRIFMLQF